MLTDTEWKAILDRLLGSTETGTLPWRIFDADDVDVVQDAWCYRARVTSSTEFRVAVARGCRGLHLTVSALWRSSTTAHPLVIAERSLTGLKQEDRMLRETARSLYHAVTRSATAAPKVTATDLLDQIDELDRRRIAGVMDRGHDLSVLVA